VAWVSALTKAPLEVIAIEIASKLPNQVGFVGLPRCRGCKHTRLRRSQKTSPLPSLRDCGSMRERVRKGY
jgi:hypothetical protein